MLARRVAIVSRVKRNPYVSLLCEGLRQPALNIQPSIVDQFSLGWMWGHRHDVDLLHFHWLELFFLYPSWTRSLKRCLSVMLGLVLARLCGICLVYTVHNIWQHEGQRSGLVWLGNLVIFSLAQAVHVHDQQAADRLPANCRRAKVHVISHGNYVSAYPNECTRAGARSQLGLGESDFVYLFLGRVRPYKGIEDLLVAFEALDDPAAVLLVAGEVHEPAYAQRIKALAAGDERIRLSLRFVSDASLQVYLNACDISVLPYRHVTTSGAGLLSLSFRTPIIAPGFGCFVGLVGKGARGILYDPQDPDALRGALRRARSADLEAMRAACARFVAELEWSKIARQHAAMYQRCD